jgi:hypothetical protein
LPVLGVLMPAPAVVAKFLAAPARRHLVRGALKSALSWHVKRSGAEDFSRVDESVQPPPMPKWSPVASAGAYGAGRASQVFPRIVVQQSTP